MLTINGFDFPETKEDAAEWQASIRRVTLASRVMCVARTRIEGQWAAYCDAVDGRNHDDEYAEVLRSGSKLLEEVARELFPCFKDIPYAR